ncbi:hypothetical protein K523DRAFT_422339 [Schizophyllum commune Tattone D]|nr:hypothetical protein K523DRAFT_422339 [Schizophyllum commune Tattone D]
MHPALGDRRARESCVSQLSLQPSHAEIAVDKDKTPTSCSTRRAPRSFDTRDTRMRKISAGVGATAPPLVKPRPCATHEHGNEHDQLMGQLRRRISATCPPVSFG